MNERERRPAFVTVTELSHGALVAIIVAIVIVWTAIVAIVIVAEVDPSEVPTPGLSCETATPEVQARECATEYTGEP